MSAINVGDRFGLLTAKVKVRISGRTYWLVQCDCGKEKLVQHGALTAAARPTRSCGCMRKEWLRAAQLRHGCSVKSNAVGFRTFICWQSMHWRCSNSSRKDYASYGGRGITVCERWESFSNFLDDMGMKPAGMSLGRVDNDLGYSPSNCRWESDIQQARNKRTNKIIEYAGERMPLISWAERTGIPKSTLQHRLSAGWNIERALTAPLRGRSSSAGR